MENIFRLKYKKFLQFVNLHNLEQFSNTMLHHVSIYIIYKVVISVWVSVCQNPTDFPQISIKISSDLPFHHKGIL